MSALQLTQVSKVYGSGPTQVHALRSIDLTVEPGELVAVMGPSGSGKSTLLTIAGSLEEPSAGEVSVGGVLLSRLSRGELAALRRRAIGYVFQDFNLLAGLTAAENVSLPMELDGVAARSARPAALAALERLGLAERADRFPDDLSGGERQRVAIARAVVGERHLLLADEPSGALDSVNGEAVMRLVRETCQGGVAGVVVTHDAQLASWADRVVFLRDGRVVDQTSPAAGPESLLDADRAPVTTTLAPPPPPVTAPRPTRGGAPARRAIRRWAWRLLRREWRQQVLVLGLLIVAVAVTTVGLGLIGNVQGTDQGQFGTADARVDISGPGPAGVAADLAGARRQFGQAEAIVHESVPVPGSVTPVDLRAQDPHGVYGKPMLRLVSGSYPVGSGQAAVTATVATTFNLKVGSTWPVNGRSLRVVGIVENPKNLEDGFGLVAPGQVSSPTGLTLLFDASGTQVTKFKVAANGGQVEGYSSSGATSAKQQRAQALAVLLLATIGLIFIGLLCVAGFTVMAQRRLRALGMIGAIGATDRQVRRVMLANGAAVGIVGATIGVVFGLAAWLALTPAFERLVGHRYDPFALPWWAVIAGGVLAVLTSLAASWWPARAAARLPIVSALSGRPVPPQPAHRFALLGTVLAAAGFVALIFARAVHTALIVGGIVAITAGMLLLAPLGIRALAAVAGRAPVAVRLALRDLVRYQTRSGAALAAASLAIGIAATIAITAAAEQAHDHTLTGGNLPANQLIVWLANPNDQGGGGSELSVAPAGGPSAPPSVPNATVVASARSTADAIAQAAGGATVVELDAAVDLHTPLPAGSPLAFGEASLVHPIEVQGRGQGWNQVTTPYVATPAVLGLYRIPAADTSPAADILSSRRDLGGVQLGTGFEGDFQPTTVQTSALLPNYTSAPNTLITPRAMAANGYTAVPVGWLVQAKQKFTSAQRTDARHRAAAAGVTTEARTGPDDALQRLRDYATGIGLLVALGVLAMTIGLIRSETARDLRTLTATGASGATRRMLNAASAGALALLGGILGTAAAYLALIAWHWHKLSYLDRPPYVDLAVLIVGLPAVAAAGAWLFGRTPRTISRRSLE